IDSDPSTDYTVDEDGDMDGFDDDEDIETIDVIIRYELGDYVWEDYDGDGIQDFNEQGISGVFVELYNAQGFFIERVQTDNNGYYLFDDVYPGNYYIRFLMPEGYSPTLFDRGENDNLDSDIVGDFGEGTTGLITVGFADDYSYDAGLIQCAPVGGLVWFDYNKNDRWDPTENGINQLRVEIFRQINGEFYLWDVTYTTHKPGTPSDDGYYKFCVNPGTYYLKFVDPPSTLVSVVPNIGFDDNKDSDVTNTYGTGTTPSFTVYSGQENCTLGAGFYVMGSIGDYVWSDDDEDGRRDVNEEGVQGVEVQAIDNEGNVVAQSVTDENGEYMIDYLGKNTYFLHFDIPDGYAMTLPNQGEDEAMDSDVDNSNGLHTTKFYIVQPGEHIGHVDAGLVSGALPVVWRDVWGENRGDYNYIEWQVESEFNLQQYEVERSVGSIEDFKSIGRVEAQNDYTRSLTYSFEDENIFSSEVHYYRIKQVDLDGRFSYSKIIAISFEGSFDEENKIALYPNPVYDQLTVEFSLFNEIEASEIDVYDELGRLVKQGLLRTAAMDKGVHKFRLDVNDMQHGIYTLKIKLDNSIYVRKVIILAQ
ncbi:MAG: T9SS type A sorting domain-containing protein, partial [Saprospiraceae bacterium]|nr:T9SS type A sorting domain-containing protein [Saprospiraceae bacterium]